LEIPRSATPEEIKKAFRMQARRYHPERWGERTEESKFKQVSEAYEVLSDPKKRQHYDTTGEVFNSPTDSVFEQFFTQNPFGRIQPLAFTPSDNPIGRSSIPLCNTGEVDPANTNLSAIHPDGPFCFVMLEVNAGLQLPPERLLRCDRKKAVGHSLAPSILSIE
jgi:curved DNA-binding protein CbpA